MTGGLAKNPMGHRLFSNEMELLLQIVFVCIIFCIQNWVKHLLV